MYVRTFKQLKKDMYEECGGKAAHLGELTALGLNVPPGFTVIGEAYYRHLEVSGLTEKIRTIAAGIDWEISKTPR